MTPESRDLAHTASRQFGSMQSIELARRAVAGENVAPAVWTELVESGYNLVGLPESADGVGDVIDLVALLEEAGRCLMPAPLWSSAAANQLLLSAGLRHGGRPEARRGFGLAVGVVSHGRVTCESASVVDGVDAELLALWVDAGDAIHVVEVDVTAEGVSASPKARDLDPSRPVLDVALDGAPVVQHRQLGHGDGQQVLVAPRVCTAADLTGIAAGALDRALQHVGQRKQFGRLIGQFQAVKHMLADAYVAVEKARGLTLGAAVALRDEPDALRTRQLSLFALGSSTAAAVDVASLNIQLLGAMGVTQEEDAHLFLRRGHQTSLAMEGASVAFRLAAELERGIAHV